MTSLADIRRFAVARALVQHPSLRNAIAHLGFVQADPIRAPARAQDLILRLRLPRYTAGELEANYETLGIEEDFSINYGFMPRESALLLHPRQARVHWPISKQQEAQRVLAHIRDKGQGHPRDLAKVFGSQTTENAWGGQSTALTQLLDGMHYRGMLRVLRRESGTRVYEPFDRGEVSATAQEAAQGLMALLVKLYAPVTECGLKLLASMLVKGAPQLRPAMPPCVKQMLRELPQAQIDGTKWLWPEGESPRQAQWPETRKARLLTPFDPLVWDRSRFEQLWGWAYRFEAYTPAKKRRLGYYALPLLVGTQVLGWANLKTSTDHPNAAPRLHAELGFVQPMAAYPHLREDVETELHSFAMFLGANGGDPMIARHVLSAW